MTAAHVRPDGPGSAKIGRRAVLLLAAASVTAASAGPSRDVPAIMQPLRSAPRPWGETITVRPVSHWANLYLSGWSYEYENSLPETRSADSWDHYDASYVVDANVAMFRATGGRRHLDRALEYVENVMDSARESSSLRSSQFRDQYRGWVSMRSDLDRPGDEIPLYESYFWRYATALLVVMRESPVIYRDPGYRARYQRLLQFAEVDIFEKWYSRGPDENIYRERTHMAAHWALIALNLSLTTQDPARRVRYQQVVDNIDLHLPDVHASLRGQLRRNPVEPTAYFWSDVWGSARRPGQDVSHGNGVMAYVVEARDRGRNWTANDMAAFSALLTKVIWPGGRTYHEYVDGTGSDNGWFSDGFVKLGRFDAAVQRRLEDHKVVNLQFAANMALNARALS
jgi:hypothetical protein